MPAFKKTHLYAACGLAFAAALGAIAISTAPENSPTTNTTAADEQPEVKIIPSTQERPSVEQVSIEPNKQPTESSNLPNTDTYERKEDTTLDVVIEEDKEFSLTLFNDVNLHITFDQVHHLKEGQTLAQGYLSGHELATVTLTKLNDRYLMSIQDMEHDLIYRITGNIETGKAQIIEVDLKKMPAQIHEH